MRKGFVGLVVGVAMVAACGEVSPIESTSGTPTVATSSAGIDQSGFGTPAQAGEEFAGLGTARPVRGELDLGADGCWYVNLDGASHLIVFPAGFEAPANDSTAIAGPDGATIASGSSVDGTAFRLDAESVPGGPASRWGNYVNFCDPLDRTLAVFDTIESAFDPNLLSGEVIDSMAANADFTRFWPCGRGWAASTEDQLVALFIYQQSSAEMPEQTTIGLPDDAWTAELVVGKHLFVNHCDDVLEPWEPQPVIAGRWPLTAGSIEILDELPQNGEVGPVRAVLTGASVTTGNAVVITFDRIALENTAFNLFAG